MRHVSDLGQLVQSAIQIKRTEKREHKPLLSGWKKAPWIPSVCEIEDTFARVRADFPESDILLASEVAASMVEYRATHTFVEDSVECFALEMYRHHRCNMLVFRRSETPCVQLYYLDIYSGVEKEIALIPRYCSELTMVFSTRFDDMYCDYRDLVIGKFGIKGSEPELEWEPCGFAPRS